MGIAHHGYMMFIGIAVGNAHPTKLNKKILCALCAFAVKKYFAYWNYPRITLRCIQATALTAIDTLYATGRLQN